MSEYIVTGRTGQNHVTSADHGAMNASFAGSGRYVAEGIGDTLSAEVVTNNLVRIHSGEVFNQGRHMRVEANTYVDCTIENGSQSKLRYDLIVFRYTKNADTGVENGEIVVIKGTAGTSAADPSYTTGNILAGALQDDMPLYRVRIEGINIVGLDKLFITVPGLAALNAKVSQLNSDIGINREELAPGFISIRQGKKRILNINGYIASTESTNNFCTLGNIDYPLYNVTFPVSVEGIGLGFVIITTSGRGTLYNNTLSDYLSGTVRGTVEYLANI